MKGDWQVRANPDTRFWGLLGRAEQDAQLSGERSTTLLKRPIRSSPISAVTPIVLPSPTVGSSARTGTGQLRWRDYRHHDKPKVMTLAASEFIRRFLLHTLPDGFRIPPLWLPSQWPPPYQARPMPTASCCAAAGAAATGRLYASAIDSSPASRSIPVRVVAARCCRWGLSRAPVEQETRPAGSMAPVDAIVLFPSSGPALPRRIGRSTLALRASAGCPTPRRPRVLTAVAALAAVSGSATPDITRSPITAHRRARLPSVQRPRHNPHSPLAPSASVQSGFNEVATCCDPTIGLRDLTVASRFPRWVSCDSEYGWTDLF